MTLAQIERGLLLWRDGAITIDLLAQQKGAIIKAKEFVKEKDGQMTTDRSRFDEVSWGLTTCAWTTGAGKLKESTWDTITTDATAIAATMPRTSAPAQRQTSGAWAADPRVAIVESDGYNEWVPRVSVDDGETMSST